MRGDARAPGSGEAAAISRQFDSARMETFSDGVFAIAITLLVLEISVPEDAFDHLLRAILDEWPSYLAYVTSFLTIGAVWFLHHALFRRLRVADATLARLNLFLLMVVAFLPFPTQLLAEAVHSVAAERAAVLFYGGVLFVMLSLLAAMCRYAAEREDLLYEEAKPSELNALSKRVAPGLVGYVGVFLLAIVAPRAAAFGFLVVAAAAVIAMDAGGDDDEAVTTAAPPPL